MINEPRVKSSLRTNLIATLMLLVSCVVLPSVYSFQDKRTTSGTKRDETQKLYVLVGLALEF